MGIFGRFTRTVNVRMSVGGLFKALCGGTVRNSPSYNKLLSCYCFSNRRVANFRGKHPLFMHSPRDGFALTGFVQGGLCAYLNTVHMNLSVLLGRRRMGVSGLLNRNNLFGAGEINRRVLTSTMSTPMSMVSATKRNKT